jgi:hypothetical protein
METFKNKVNTKIKDSHIKEDFQMFGNKISHSSKEFTVFNTNKIIKIINQAQNFYQQINFL